MYIYDTMLDIQLYIYIEYIVTGCVCRDIYIVK